MLLYESHFMHFLGKLHTRWMGPYVVDVVYPNGSVQLKTLEGSLLNTRINQERVKKYYTKEEYGARGVALQLREELCVRVKVPKNPN